MFFGVFPEVLNRKIRTIITCRAYYIIIAWACRRSTLMAQSFFTTWQRDGKPNFQSRNRLVFFFEIN